MAPKKRGRPLKNRDAEQQEEITTETRPRKRRRPEETGERGDDQEQGEGSRSSRPGKRVAKAATEAGDTEEQGSTEKPGRRNKRAPQLDNSPVEAAPPESRANQGQAEGQVERKRGRPGRKPASHGEQPVEESPAAEGSSARRSQRDRRSAGDKPWWAGSQGSAEVAGSSQPAPAPQKRKGGRPSLAEVPVSKAQNQTSPSHTGQTTKKGRGRPSRTLSLIHI